MQHGKRLNKVQARKVERYLRENADLVAEQQATELQELLGFNVAAVTVYRWRKRFDVPSPRDAKRYFPVALAGWELNTFRRMMGQIYVPVPSTFENRISLEIPGLDEVMEGDEVFRFTVSEDWDITAVWLTPDEMERLLSVFEISDRRRDGHLVEELERLHDLGVEYANRAFWQGIRKGNRLKQETPTMRRIPPGKLPEADEELEREWLRITARKLTIQCREFKAAAALAVTS